MRNRTKFRADRSNRSRDIAIFGFRHLGFLKFLKFLTVETVKMVAKFRQNRSNRDRHMVIFHFFQDGGCPPSLICDACVWTTHERHLIVFITVQNLAEIDEVILMHVFRFRVRLKTTICVQKCFFAV